MLIKKKFTRRSAHASLAGLLLGVAALGLSNVALAYDFAKLETAIETLTPETVHNWEQKARAGDALAQNLIGLAYGCGAGGVTPDRATAVKWFQMAAEQGEADAQFNLASLYRSDVDGNNHARPVPANDAEALKWYQRSAEQSHTQAQVKLAELYAKGARNVPRDQVQAFKWLSLAAASGEPTAEKLLGTYAAQMQQDQLREAESLVKKWKGK